MGKTYVVNEVFYSIQGEGVRVGVPSIFVRFTGCNMRCSVQAGDKSPGGFDCDTEFESGRKVTAEELLQWIQHEHNEWHINPAIVFTGGEPGLQVDADLCTFLHDAGYFLCIETNGSVDLKAKCAGCFSCGTALDFITVSPKVAEHAIKQTQANEVRYVRGYGQALPKTEIQATHYCISPAFDGVVVTPDTMAWCIKLVKENPRWRLSVQTHKLLNVR